MKRVLVVDDQPNIRKLIRLSLSAAHDVFEAHDAVEAMQLIPQLRPDLLILDVMMPGAYNGLQVLEWVRLSSEFKDLPVIMVTAMGQEEDVALGMKLGATAYLTKPFRPADLNKLVDTLKCAHCP